MAQARSRTVALPAIVDLDALEPIRDELIDAVEAGPVKVTGAAVERVATNALFMLMSAAETARRNNFAFAVTNPSEPFRLAVERLGLAGAFAAFMKG
jgi:anti-anti-sigma regulatory factor